MSQGLPSEILTKEESSDKSDLKATKAPAIDDEPKSNSSPKSRTLALENLDPARLSVMREYFNFGVNRFLLTVIGLLFVITQISCSVSDYFVSIWTRHEETKSNVSKVDLMAGSLRGSITFDNFSSATYAIISGFFTATILVIGTTRAFGFYANTIQVSKNVHKLMLGRILGAPLHFFETNPSGRILNRFSADLGSMDEQLPKVMLDSYQMTLVIIGAICVTVAVNPLFAIPIIVLITIFGQIRSIYLRTSKNIKRLDGICK